jgi:hypothetical protein
VRRLNQRDTGLQYTEHKGALSIYGPYVPAADGQAFEPIRTRISTGYISFPGVCVTAVLERGLYPRITFGL